MLAMLLAATAEAQVTRSAAVSLPPTGGEYSHIVSTELPPGSRLVVVAGQVGADSTDRIMAGNVAAQISLTWIARCRRREPRGTTW